MYSSLPDSPQGIGDLIGLAFRITRRNISTIFRFILVPSIFTLAAGVMFQWVFTYGTAAVSESRNFSSALSLVGLFLLAFTVFSLSWWVLGMRLLALTRVVLGFAPTLEEASKYMMRRRWALAGIYMLGVAAVIAICVMLIVAGAFVIGFASAFPVGGETMKLVITAVALVVIGFGLIFVACFYMLAAHVAYSVLACEDQPVGAVLGRSLALTFQYFWRGCAFGLLFMVTFSIISYPLSLPVAVVTFFDALRNGLSSTGGIGAAYKPPLYLLVLTQVWEAGMGVLLRPLLVFAFGLFYYDLRMRRDGIDIKRQLKAIEGAQA